MYLKNIHLRQFRNYLDQKVVFDAPKTILVGNNAQGKSNLLEAVELLSTLKSHRATRDRDLILDSKPMGQIEATLERQTGSIDLALTMHSQARRTCKLNGEPLRRHLDFLSILNVVQFSCLDLDLVRGGPEIRRNWIDRLVIQLEPIYAHILQQYNQILRQRNALLKSSKEIRKADFSESFDKMQFMGNKIASSQNREEFPIPNSQFLPPLGGVRGGLPNAQFPMPHAQFPIPNSELALWDAQLATAGARVIRRRDRVLERLMPLARNWHSSISGSTEVLDVKYAANIEVGQEFIAKDNLEGVRSAFLDKIQQRAIAEKFQGTTLVGPHRDDITFTINNTPARQYGSQGQQRTLVLALKLAELQLIEEVVGEPPLLLLDDVLAELDLNRQNQLLETIQERFQTLITTTHLGAFDSRWLQQTQILTVVAGQINQF
jgi:DNA replication and repair protein RecF